MFRDERDVSIWPCQGKPLMSFSIDTNLTSPALVYALDIETDTELGGLDPRTAPIVAVALSGDGWAQVFDGDEVGILHDLDAAIAALAPGVITTWNGARFDLPFLSDRAALHGATLGLCLHADDVSRSPHEPLPGHEGGYFATWYEHRHLDAYRVYRADVGAFLHLPCGLKMLARFVGLSPVEVDRKRVHDLTAQELHDYVASDAIMTRELALRRWQTAKQSIDAVPVASGQRISV